MGGANLAALVVVVSVLWFGVFAPRNAGAGQSSEATQAISPSQQSVAATPTYPPPTQPLEVTPTIGPTADCTIDKMSARYEIRLQPPVSTANADRSVVKADLATRYPFAMLRDEATVTVTTETFPDLNGLTVLMYLISGDVGPPPGGPVGQTLGPVQGMCALVFYDAKTGAYISTVGHVTFST